MRLKADFYSNLSTYAGLTALVGKRIYLPRKVPQNVTWPYLTYSVAGRERIYSHQGFSGLERYRLRVRIFAKDVEGGDTGSTQVDNISAQVIAAMEAWPSANSKIQSCFHDTEQDEEIVEEDTEFEYDGLPMYFGAHYAP